jgi:hypothetical protein
LGAEDREATAQDAASEPGDEPSAVEKGAAEEGAAEQAPEGGGRGRAMVTRPSPQGLQARRLRLHPPHSPVWQARPEEAGRAPEIAPPIARRPA